MRNRFSGCLLILSVLLQSCSSIKTADKTQFIRQKNKLKTSDCVAIISPYTFCGEVEYDEYSSIKDSLSKESEVNLKSLHENTFVENSYKMRCYYDCYRFFRQRLTYYIPPITDNEYKLIGVELKKIENVLKKTKVDSLKISDSLSNILTKYSATHYMLIDIKEYYRCCHHRGRNDLFIIKVFSINKETKNINYYNYKIYQQIGHAKINQPNIKWVLNKLKKILPKYDNNFLITYQ